MTVCVVSSNLMMNSELPLEDVHTEWYTNIFIMYVFQTFIMVLNFIYSEKSLSKRLYRLESVYTVCNYICTI